MTQRFHVPQILTLIPIGVLLSPAVKTAFQHWQLTWAYILILSWCITFALMPLIRRLAFRLDAVDHPGGRKTHEQSTPLMGGTAIFIGFALVLLFAQDILHFTPELKGVALAGTLIFVIGLLDDIWGLSARIRLISQFLAVGILVKYGVVLSFLPQTWWGDIGEFLMTLFWVVGITNAINFLDGMDGLASGTTAINALFFSLVALPTNDLFMQSMMLLSIALAGSCLGFLPYNFRRKQPASIFLGDSGSNFLGFILAGIGILGKWGTSEAGIPTSGEWDLNNLIRLTIPIIILGVPIFDTTLTTIVRIKTGQVRSFKQWVHFTGRDHFHHRLSDLGIGNKKAVWVIYLVSVVQGLEALVLKNARGIDAIFSLLQVSIVFLLIGSFMVFVQNQYTRLMKIRREK
ncbi:MAG: MraY family glycosyltransferase [bacterium]|nr:MraY family glycosyltransferase [bacterium]